MTPTTVRVQVDGHPPGDNVARRWHWTGRAQSNAGWRRTAFWAALAARDSTEHPWDRATLRIVWLCKVKRRRDIGNLIGACKPLIDGLVDAGLIRDDDSRTLVGISASVEQAERDGVRLELSRA